MIGIHSVQQTLICCLLCASKGAARGSLGFLQGLAFPHLPTEPPTAAGCPPPPQWAGLPTPASTLPRLAPRARKFRLRSVAARALLQVGEAGPTARTLLLPHPPVPSQGFCLETCKVLPFPWKQVLV